MDGPSLWQRLKTSLQASAGDVVFGMEDGTVSIFGLVFGVAATTTDQKVMLIAGEASGDALGAGLARALKARLGADGVSFVGVGGISTL